MKCVWFEKCKLKGQYVKPKGKKQTWKYANTVRCEKCLFYETNNCPKQNRQKKSSFKIEK